MAYLFRISKKLLRTWHIFFECLKKEGSAPPGWWGWRLAGPPIPAEKRHWSPLRKKTEDSWEIIFDLVQCFIVWIRVNDYLEESFGRFGRDCVRPKDILTMLQVAFLPRQAAEHCEDDEDDKRVMMNFDALDEDRDGDGDDNIMMSVSNSSFSQGRRLSGKIHLTSAFNAPM